MKAVILAGGLGTRLRPVTYEIPKPLIPIQGRVLLEHVFDILKEAGVDEVYLAIGYLADKIQAYFGDGERCGIKLHYIIEEKPLGTAGWMKRVKPFKGDFFVINGDNLFDIDLKDVLRLHQEKKAVGTIALTQVKDVTAFGIAALDGNRITRFVEKPQPQEAPSNFANSGYYIFNEKVFQMLPEGDVFMFEKDILPMLAEKGMLFCYKSEAQWFDTGTFERWEAVIKEWRRK